MKSYQLMPKEQPDGRAEFWTVLYLNGYKKLWIVDICAWVCDLQIHDECALAVAVADCRL
jgi:hypothetical protein